VVLCNPLTLACIQNNVAFLDARAWGRASAPEPPARASRLGAGRRRDGGGIVLATRHRVPTTCTSWLHRKRTGPRPRMGRDKRNYSHGPRQRPRHSRNACMRTSRRNTWELSGMRWSHLLPNIHEHPQSACGALQRCSIDDTTAHTPANTDDSLSTRILGTRTRRQQWVKHHHQGGYIRRRRVTAVPAGRATPALGLEVREVGPIETPRHEDPVYLPATTVPPSVFALAPQRAVTVAQAQFPQMGIGPGRHQPMQIIPSMHVKSPEAIFTRRGGETVPRASRCTRRVAPGQTSPAAPSRARQPGLPRWGSRAASRRVRYTPPAARFGHRGRPRRPCPRVAVPPVPIATGVATPRRVPRPPAPPSPRRWPPGT